MRRRTAQFIETQKASTSPEGKRTRGADRKPRKVAPASIANLDKGKDTQFQPGQSGNPGGLPGTDLSAVYARRFYETHPEGIGPKMAEDLKGFNAYAYNVLADRAYGKNAEKHEITGEGGGPLDIKITIVKARNGGN